MLNIFTFINRDPALLEIKEKLKQTPQKVFINSKEREIIQETKRKTSRLNLNNITRTKAYLEFYKEFPEIEWAFLAHLVSRNAGWNMTDLQGSFLSALITDKEKETFFNFLERANWLIFQDAYPQLLLYKESIQQQTNLFHLLTSCGVSYFMEVLWNHFYHYRNKYLLSTALIINEQSYIEKRVIQHTTYQKSILKSAEFKIQDFLQLNQILFPYHDKQKIKLLGQSVHHFASLEERILLGKRLYQIVFDNMYYLTIFDWAKNHTHTGSRSDFWPQLFHPINENLPGKLQNPMIENCKVISASARIYSPVLSSSWPNSTQVAAENGDWFSKWQVIGYLKKHEKDLQTDMTRQYCQSIEKLQFAAIAKGMI
ncbi:uncharacterized protein YppC [Gracilibacillus boraciitolerans JCM 21714]|uniref:Uncharacterized protein YppC n=1 Tax=Gracilibacillus boraciitolerans JCM 21714 TaxID=1298598 RepID=W4VCG7_9BACI|nr:DUF2515 family protein [Gracilibacillus boraciitolerans]GAE91115.1 uncharacterized protein YppC [Gracilibacillus boraciitolerans JCM 21714]